MSHTILCLSRSYLSRFLPALGVMADDMELIHIVQTESEKAYIEGEGGRVVLCFETAIREGLHEKNPPQWQEPEDFRELVRFDWSPIYSDRHLAEFSEPVRSRIAGILQRELRRLFEEHDVAGFLSEPVALFPTHYCLYLCKKHDARPLLWANAFWPGYFYFAHQSHIAEPIRREPREQAGPELRQAVADYVQLIAADAAGPVYHHQFAKKKQHASDYFQQRAGRDALIVKPGLGFKAIQLARVVRTKTAQTFFPGKYDYMTAASAGEHTFYLRNLMSKPSQYDTPPLEYDAKNIFFPLQYEPEASLLYSAPDFQDQQALIRSLATALPAGATLWVKEHPNQFGVLGRRCWQKLRRRYSNVRLVFGRANGRELIKASGLAVVITSQAGIDAMILGRKTILLGDVFYRGMSGSIPVRSMAEAAAALQDKANYGVFEHKDALVAELADLARHCYPGDPQPSSTLYDEENMRHLVDAIRSELAPPMR